MTSNSIPDISFARSEALLARALKTIPLGTQTFSKSATQYPHGVSPYFARNGKGGHLWDVDGNEYVDMVMGLLSVMLGYCDPDIDAAARAQMDQGCIFSLPHTAEIDIAEKLREIVPCAEMTRFGKNGSDATSGAVRLARAYTRRDHVACCGYHGWQDWFIGSTARNLGVPQAVRDLTHPFIYNDLDSLAAVFRQWPGDVAAVILEPMNVVEPEPGFLENVRDMAHANGAVLVFDEMITGFRFAKGGAQEHFGVTPDLATFGKGLANGYPLSAISGRAEIMRLMEDVFFSFTMGGEAVSLAAAGASLDKLRREPVNDHLRTLGTKLTAGVSARIERHGIGDFLSLSGHPCWTFLNFSDANGYSLWEIKTLFLQEVFARGILTIGTHNLCYAHMDSDLETLFRVYDQVFPILHEAVRNRSLNSFLRCEPLQPLFRVR